MTTTAALFVRRFVADYSRNGVNLTFLVLVPFVTVVVAAGTLGDAAELLSGGRDALAVETATAGWVAGFLTAIAMYFQIAAARDTDRRLVIAGLPGRRLVLARLLTGLVIAALISAVALVALAARTGLGDPPRVIVGTLMFAVIYLALGAVVGAVAPNPVNGTALILFVWLLDVWLGPVLGSNRADLRAMPTHFVSLWMVDLPSRHGGRVGDFGWALAWTVGAVVVAFAVVAATSRVAGSHRRRIRPGSATHQLLGSVRMGWRDWRRNPVFWVLLIVVPAVFILLADVTTPHGSAAIVLSENGRQFTALIDPANVHGGLMASIAVGFLATLAGLFTILDARTGDQRLVLAGMRSGVVLSSRLAIVLLAALAATAVSLAAAALVLDPGQWVVYATALLLIAITYGLIGVLLGPIFGKISGVFIAFLIPFLDIGIGQSPMLRAEPETWAHYLPAYGGTQLLTDGALTTSFDQTSALLIALAWIAALGIAAAALLHHTARTAA